MKKIIMMLALLAIPFAIQAQTKFHDVEANDAKGAVKAIKSQMMGQDQIVTFTEDGKQEGLTDAQYDADGYLQSAKLSSMGMEVSISYKWENGRIKSQSMNVMGQDMTTTATYNEKGELVSQTMDMGGQKMEITFSDYKYDDKGNWISRKGSAMGQAMDQPRTIEYYE